MTDAQYLFDLAARQYNEVADSIESHFENVANQIRDWLPQGIQPPPPPPRKLPPASTWATAQRWISRNRAISAGILAFVATGAVLLLIQKRSISKKRRAKRSANGARTEIVVLAGSATSPLTTALALDLERRGFVVYIMTSTAEEEAHVRSQSRIDVMPLELDLVSGNDQLDRLRHVLSRPHHAIERAPPHRLTLAGVIVIPNLESEVGLVSDLTPDTWSTALNAKVLGTIMTVQRFLPLVESFHSRILVITPSIISSLRPPHHAIDCTIGSALDAFSTSVAAELRLQELYLSQIKLGNLDIPGSRRRVEGSPSKSRGTPIRNLHDTVFDALQADKPRSVYHVGRGSRTYSLVGNILPAGLVAWMMGFNRAATVAGEEVEGLDEGSEGSVQWEKIEQQV